MVSRVSTAPNCFPVPSAEVQRENKRLRLDNRAAENEASSAVSMVGQVSMLPSTSSFHKLLCDDLSFVDIIFGQLAASFSSKPRVVAARRTAKTGDAQLLGQ